MGNFNHPRVATESQNSYIFNEKSLFEEVNKAWTQLRYLEKLSKEAKNTYDQLYTFENNYERTILIYKKAIENNKISCKSIRGKRYFGPSKMSFLNLIKHSLSIISVFRRNVLIRSIFFLVIYFFLIYKNISNITLIPFYMVILLNIFSFYFANRENMDEYNTSLQNIQNINVLK